MTLLPRHRPPADPSTGRTKRKRDPNIAEVLVAGICLAIVLFALYVVVAVTL